jgi:hypothetical protein
VSKPKKSVVTTEEDRPLGFTTKIFGALVLSFGNCPALALNSVLACANFFVTADLLEKCSCANGCFLNFDRQSKRTIGLTTTSPTSNSLPMPPAVPVVMTSVGCTSVMIWRQTSMFGSCGPSCDMCESDLKITTFFLPIVVVQ